MLSLFIENVKNNIPFVFTKFGDGEIICICKRYYIDAPPQNCDRQSYSDKLSDMLIESAKYFSDKKVFIGNWNFDTHYTNIFNIFIKENNISFNYVNYDILLHNENKDISKLKELYLEISKSKLKKIYICSERNKSAKDFLNCDLLIVNDNEAFDYYESIRNEILNKEYDIYLYSCGLMSKVLIKDVMMSKSNKIQLDIGSGLDNMFNDTTRLGQIQKDKLIEFYEVT